MVRRQILEFGKTTAVYGLGNILNKITAFLLIPVYVKYLSLAEVGSIALIELLESFLILFLLSGLIQSIWKRLKNAQRIEKK
jgi:O-antigen/teichoic acid export membrane protein